MFVKGSWGNVSFHKALSAALNLVSSMEAGLNATGALAQFCRADAEAIKCWRSGSLAPDDVRYELVLMAFPSLRTAERPACPPYEGEDTISSVPLPPAFVRAAQAAGL